MKYLSTSALANEKGLEPRELFKKLSDKKWIYRKDDQWHLTQEGKIAGGTMNYNPNYGEYIVWPINMDIDQEIQKEELINATSVGQEFDLSSQRINLIFSEIGWIEKGLKGWHLTSLGKKVGGVELVHQSGGTYVMWPENIIHNKALRQSINKDENNNNHEVNDSNERDILYDFRSKFPANHRTKDGHMVRSRAEVIIDNALYDYGLAHAYERKLPIEENVYSDFYIPSQNGSKACYIEFWGMESDPKYSERMKIKKEVYKKNNLNLIELGDKQIENLDDYLPRLLLEFGIRVE